MGNSEDIAKAKADLDEAIEGFVTAQADHASVNSKYESAQYLVETAQEDERQARHELEEAEEFLRGELANAVDKAREASDRAQARYDEAAAEEARRAARIEKAQSEYESLKKAHGELLEKIEKIEGDLGSISERYASAESAIQSKQDKRKDVESKLSEANERIDNVRAEVSAVLDSEDALRVKAVHAEASEEIERLERLHAEEASSFSKARTALSEALARQSEAQSVYDSALNAYRTSGAGSKLSEYSDAQQAFEKAKRDVLSAGLQADGAIRGVIFYETESSVARAAVVSAKDYLCEAEDALLKVSKALVEAKDSVRLTKDISPLYDRALFARDNARSELAECETLAEEKAKALIAAQERALRTQEAYSAAKESLPEMRKRFEEAEAQLGQARVEDAEEKQRLNEAEAAFEDAKQAVSVAQGEIDDGQEARIADIEASLKEARGKLDAVGGEYEKVVEEEAAAQKRIDIALKAASDLEEKIAKFDEDIAKAQQARDAVRAEEEGLADELANAQRESEDMVDDLEVLQGRIADAEEAREGEPDTGLQQAKHSLDEAKAVLKNLKSLESAEATAVEEDASLPEDVRNAIYRITLAKENLDKAQKATAELEGKRDLAREALEKADEEQRSFMTKVASKQRAFNKTVVQDGGDAYLLDAVGGADKGAHSVASDSGSDEDVAEPREEARAKESKKKRIEEIRLSANTADVSRPNIESSSIPHASRYSVDGDSGHSSLEIDVDGELYASVYDGVSYADTNELVPSKYFGTIPDFCLAAANVGSAYNFINRGNYGPEYDLGAVDDDPPLISLSDLALEGDHPHAVNRLDSVSFFDPTAA